MTERIEAPTQEQLAAIAAYRERVHALYHEVRSWLGGDKRFRFEQCSSTVADGLGEYEVERLRIFAAEDCVADFRPVAATVVLAAGAVDVIGLVDYAWLNYHERRPMAVTTLTRRDGTSARHSKPIIPGIHRPGWYWTDLRHDCARFLDRRVLF
ncbi:MAG TPA: hypothetical protein VK669_15235, partial [Candidatus Limnocylindrales bacterium]|nr:hypothetical protein [Candidatus Limnocylindrales bacterium]